MCGCYLYTGAEGLIKMDEGKDLDFKKNFAKALSEGRNSDADSILRNYTGFHFISYSDFFRDINPKLVEDVVYEGWFNKHGWKRIQLEIREGTEVYVDGLYKGESSSSTEEDWYTYYVPDRDTVAKAVDGLRGYFYVREIDYTRVLDGVLDRVISDRDNVSFLIEDCYAQRSRDVR